jgi:hypothetical protein
MSIFHRADMAWAKNTAGYGGLTLEQMKGELAQRP